MSECKDTDAELGQVIALALEQTGGLSIFRGHAAFHAMTGTDDESVKIGHGATITEAVRDAMVVEDGQK